MFRIEIPRLPPADLSPNARVHFYHRADAVSEAQVEVIALIREQRSIGAPLHRARVTVTFTVPDQRRRDKGNLIAAAKPFVDALTIAHVIRDDAWQFTEEVYPPIRYEKGVQMTVIVVEPLEDDADART